MVANGKATSAFTNFTKKAGVALKSLGAALGSMAVMWAITTVIGKVVEEITQLDERAEALTDTLDIHIVYLIHA